MISESSMRSLRHRTVQVISGSLARLALTNPPIHVTKVQSRSWPDAQSGVSYFWRRDRGRYLTSELSC